ncbi:MAG: hypothetical protein LUB61_02850, partial [Eggerthellaceae bacterium]|nr:hypothetical protein [Eggerthellaceae bacterium]
MGRTDRDKPLGTTLGVTLIAITVIAIIAFCIWHLGPANAAAKYPYSLSYKSDGLGVTLSYGDEGDIPDGTQINLTEYSAESDEYAELLAQAASLYGNDGVFGNVLALINIGLTNNGIAIPMPSNSALQIELDGVPDGAELQVTAFDPAATIDANIEVNDGRAVISFKPDGHNDYLISYKNALARGVNTKAEEETDQYTAESTPDTNVSLMLDQEETGRAESVLGHYQGNGHQTETNGFTQSALSGFWFLINPNLTIPKVNNSLDESKVSVDENGSKYISGGDTNFYMVEGDNDPTTWPNAKKLDFFGDIRPASEDSLISMGETEHGVRPIIVDVTDLVNSDDYKKWYNNTDGNTSYTIKDAGSLYLENAIMIDGEEADVELTFDSIELYGSYAKQWSSTHSNKTPIFGHTGTGDDTRYYFSIGFILTKDYTSTSNNFKPGSITIGQTYSNRAGVTDDNHGFAGTGYFTFPCLQDVVVTIDIIYDNNEENV